MNTLNGIAASVGRSSGRRPAYSSVNCARIDPDQFGACAAALAALILALLATRDFLSLLAGLRRFHRSRGPIEPRARPLAVIR
jgi:hypothetical protein